MFRKQLKRKNATDTQHVPLVALNQLKSAHNLCAKKNVTVASDSKKEEEESIGIVVWRKV